MILVITLLDVEEVSVNDLTEFYREHWNAQLDLPSLKHTMQLVI